MSDGSAKVVVTGPGWMGDGLGSIETALERLMREATREILITAYSVTSGADRLLDWLEDALARGVEVRLIVNRVSGQAAVKTIKRLHRLVGTYPYFYLYDFQPDEQADLHAKIFVVDRDRALIGSSNLSRRGLLNNHELAVLIQGVPVRSVASAIDRLVNSRYVRRITEQV
jgi:phosphatidylserine/phosphatidylglycerophosphate/cardiolipin synthase-like enzyme